MQFHPKPPMGYPPGEVCAELGWKWPPSRLWRASYALRRLVYRLRCAIAGTAPVKRYEPFWYIRTYKMAHTENDKPTQER
jgi:hypothetical protein